MLGRSLLVCLPFQGFIMKKEFIAAQGPLPRTLNDFWRMVWEKDVRAIAMLTRCVELGKVRNKKQNKKSKL